MVKRKQRDRARVENIVQGSRSLLKWMGMKETQFEIGEHRFERVSKTKRNAEKIGSSRKTRRLCRRCRYLAVSIKHIHQRCYVPWSPFDSSKVADAKMRYVCMKKKKMMKKRTQ